MIETDLVVIESAPVIAVVGGQDGDEGKGKVVDLLAQSADMIIRAHGGDNAGHTVKNSFGKFVTHLIPSGIFYRGKINIIGAGVALNPTQLVEEIDHLDKAGVSMSGLMISERAHAVLAHHLTRDILAEQARGRDPIGTTGRGIGPAYGDKINRIGLPMHLLRNPDHMMVKLASSLEIIRKGLEWADLGDEFRPDFYEESIWELSRRLVPHIRDTGKIARDYQRQENKTILLEGAQGTWLDIDRGGYPFVTSSGTTAASLVNGAELAPCKPKTVLVVKAYQTRVGEGPMPTEMRDEQGETAQGINIRESAGEIGATTGRLRRIANYDAVLVDYAVEINDPDAIAMTRLDSMSGMGEFAVCKSYLLDGQPIDYIPTDQEDYARCQAVYDEKRYSWNDNIIEVRDYHEFPEVVVEYTKDTVVDRYPKVKEFIFGVGPERDAIATLTRP